MHFIGETHDGRSYQNLDVVLMYLPVLRGVLSFEIGVDRHLINTASTVFRYPIHGHGAALFPDEGQCIICDFNLHNTL